jgi:hypothetical protein
MMTGTPGSAWDSADPSVKYGAGWSSISASPVFSQEASAVRRGCQG